MGAVERLDGGVIARKVEFAFAAPANTDSIFSHDVSFFIQECMKGDCSLSGVGGRVGRGSRDEGVFWNGRGSEQASLDMDKERLSYILVGAVAVRKHFEW